jgi:hypothetical protein
MQYCKIFYLIPPRHPGAGESSINLVTQTQWRWHLLDVRVLTIYIRSTLEYRSNPTEDLFHLFRSAVNLNLLMPMLLRERQMWENEMYHDVWEALIAMEAM